MILLKCDESKSKDNPVFYVQYLCWHHSVLTKSKKVNIDVSDETLILADMHLLGHESELNIVRKICEWPRLIELAAKHNEPHRIAFYLYELASEFHSYWNMGKRYTFPKVY